MNVENLVTMANQIGTFFSSFPDREEAQAGIATHIERYWAPRMRNELFQYMDRTQGGELDPIVLSAITGYRKKRDAPQVSEDTSVPKDEDTGGDAG